MFELSVALKYLIPRWRQLSVSIISLISVLVIALVVWLTVVFFSVSHGLEKSWIQKLIALSAPVRITPTEEYFKSYYYLIDSISSNSDYTIKEIQDKLNASLTDPYDPDVDEEIPVDWQSPDLNQKGELKDIVKLAYQAIQNADISGINANPYEIAVANIQLHSLRPETGLEEPSVNQSIYLSSYDAGNPALKKALLATSEQITELPSSLPNDNSWESILLPKSYQAAGVRVGDRGSLSYYSPTASMMLEHKIPIVVNAFYDPGILPVANKMAIVNPSITTIIRSAYPKESVKESNGINVRFANLDDADKVKNLILNNFKKAGIDKYWKLETFREFEFSKDILQQLRSEKNLFRLISAIIILVACSNIISMLIILVNDKKLEIGILRSMGATSKSIAAIFGFCGMVMGMLGSLLGIFAAAITLHYLDALINFISRMQGFDMFNPVFYGETLPNELSFEALTFVLGAAAATSLIAGIVPAIKACMLRPSQILRSE